MMKIRNFCLLLIALVAFTSCGSDGDEELVGNWVALGSFDGVPRSEATGFVIGDTAYVCLGASSRSVNRSLSDLVKYDAHKKTWTTINPFPGAARHAASAFVVGGKAYVGLGFNNETKEIFKDFYEYNPTTGNWIKVTTDFPGAARYMAVAASIGSKGYVGTGFDGTNTLKDFYVFTPGTTPGSGTWAETSGYEGNKRQGASTFVIGNYLYLLGGTDNQKNVIDMQKYDPATDKWEKVLDFRNTDKTSDDDKYDMIPRSFASTFVINGKGYITLGKVNSNISTTFEYDPVQNKWEEKTTFGAASRSSAIGFSLSESAPTRGFILTGVSSSVKLDDFHEFFPNDEDNEYDDY